MLNFIAVASFFAILERVGTILPDALTTPAMRAVPVALNVFRDVLLALAVRLRGITSVYPRAGADPSPA